MNFFEHIEGVISTKISLFKEIFSLALLEAKLAKLNIPSLLIWLALTLPLILTIWLLAMGTLGYLLLPLTNNQLFIDMLIVLALNLIVLMIVIFRIKKLYQMMCFNKTRHSMSLL